MFDVNIMRMKAENTKQKAAATNAQSVEKRRSGWVEVDPLELVETYGERVAIVIFDAGCSDAEKIALESMRRNYRVFRRKA